MLAVVEQAKGTAEEARQAKRFNRVKREFETARRRSFAAEKALAEYLANPESASSAGWGAADDINEEAHVKVSVAENVSWKLAAARRNVQQAEGELKKLGHKHRQYVAAKADLDAKRKIEADINIAEAKKEHMVYQNQGKTSGSEPESGSGSGSGSGLESHTAIHVNDTGEGSGSSTGAGRGAGMWGKITGAGSNDVLLWGGVDEFEDPVLELFKKYLYKNARLREEGEPEMSMQTKVQKKIGNIAPFVFGSVFAPNNISTERGVDQVRTSDTV